MDAFHNDDQRRLDKCEEEGRERMRTKTRWDYASCFMPQMSEDKSVHMGRFDLLERKRSLHCFAFDIVDIRIE